MSLQGIDVSAYQATLDFAAVPMDFVFVKSTGGPAYVNPYWVAQCDAAAQSGVTRQGLYHFAGDGWQGTTAKQEADHFINTVGSRQAGKILVLDWEQGSLISNPGWAVEFCNRIADWSGRAPMVYANGAALAYNLSALKDRGVELWHAWYGNDARIDGYNPPARPGANWWGQGLVFQYTQRGRLPGYGGYLDLNVFYGDGAAWDRLAKGGTNEDPFIEELLGRG